MIKKQKMSIFKNSENIVELTNAMVALKPIIGWRESAQLLLAIQEKISSIQMEKQRAECRAFKVYQHCGGKFKGVFTKHCSVCKRPKDY
jgi:hypothetical protein